MSFLAFTRLSFNSANSSSYKFLSFHAFTDTPSFSFHFFSINDDK